MFTLAENVAHNLCNSNNTAPSIGIIRVTIYVANEKVSQIQIKSKSKSKSNQKVLFKVGTFYNNHRRMC
jgi:hypothetical protein